MDRRSGSRERQTIQPRIGVDGATATPNDNSFDKPERPAERRDQNDNKTTTTRPERQNLNADAADDADCFVTVTVAYRSELF